MILLMNRLTLLDHLYGLYRNKNLTKSLFQFLDLCRTSVTGAINFKINMKRPNETCEVNL